MLTDKQGNVIFLKKQDGEKYNHTTNEIQHETPHHRNIRATLDERFTTLYKGHPFFSLGERAALKNV